MYAFSSTKKKTWRFLFWRKKDKIWNTINYIFKVWLIMSPNTVSRIMYSDNYSNPKFNNSKNFLSVLNRSSYITHPLCSYLDTLKMKAKLSLFISVALTFSLQILTSGSPCHSSGTHSQISSFTQSQPWGIFQLETTQFGAQSKRQMLQGLNRAFIKQHPCRARFSPFLCKWTSEIWLTFTSAGSWKF